MIATMDEEHAKQHDILKENICAFIDKNRGKLGIEDHWIIEVNISCGRHAHGLVEWVPDTYEATLGIRCDLPGPLVRWVTTHELIELSLYRSGTVIDQFARTVRESGLREVADLFMSQYRVARNQEIEEEVGRYLCIRRPARSDCCYE
jgi:hypothetical protein